VSFWSGLAVASPFPNKHSAAARCPLRRIDGTSGRETLRQRGTASRVALALALALALAGVSCSLYISVFLGLPALTRSTRASAYAHEFVAWVRQLRRAYLRYLHAFRQRDTSPKAVLDG